MAIIKSAKTNESARRAVVLDLGDLRAEAARLERDATERARAIIDEAQRERERLLDTQRSEGYDDGFEEGRAAGLESGRTDGRSEALESQRERIEQALDAWNAALGQFETQRAELQESARQDVIRLALEIAQKVIHRAIEHDPDLVRAQLDAALEHTLAPSRLTIEAHADDLAKLEDVLPQLSQRLGGCEQIVLRELTGASPGSIRLSTGRGEIDATIETQVARIVGALLPASTGEARVDEAEPSP